MELQEWEIWHTHSSFFLEPIFDLRALAKKLVHQGIAECCVLTNGESYWKEDEKVQPGKITINVHPDNSRTQFEIQPVPQPPFVVECLKQAAYFRFAEVRLFKGDNVLSSDYLRVYLGECRLNTEKHEIGFYPVITIYQSGVVITEARIISPERGVSYKEFIEEYVNLFKWPFHKVTLPPGLAHSMTQADIFYRKNNWDFPWRIKLAVVDFLTKRRIKAKAFKETSGDFEFSFYTLEDPEKDKPMSGYTISDFSQLLMMVVGWTMTRRRLLPFFLLLGERQLPQIGSYWTSQPHCYLVRHSDQKKTASENEETHGHIFGWIMSRIAGDGVKGRAYLPTNSRSFDDYGAYIGSQGSVWVWSQSGEKKQRKADDVNRAGFVYEPQVMMELSAYINMLYRQFGEVVNTIDSTDRVLTARRRLAELQIRMREVSSYGEIRNLMQRSWKELGINELRNHVRELLNIRNEEKRIEEGRNEKYRDLLISVFFGTLATPTVASEFVIPLWKTLGWSIPQSEDLTKVAGNLLTFGIIMVLLHYLLLFMRASKKKYL